ncbi:MAG: helix-turn-helix domain-containing protein [Candidatus Ornithomonoglobus sp.]
MTDGNIMCIKKVTEHIENHYQEKIFLDDAAALAKMSKSSFCREFKKMTNKSFLNYLNNYRLDKAYEYVKSTDKKIKEIAAECGFSSVQSFERDFKKKYGQAPLQVRKLLTH